VTGLYGGVETGGTWCVCALGSGPDALLAEEQFPTGEDPERTVGQIASFFAARPKPAALGVGAFGPLDLDRDSPTWGSVTRTPKPGWGDFPLGPSLAARLGVPVAIDTDVAAAALAEHRWGAGRGAGSLAYVTVGTGVGVGLLCDGRPWHGLVHPEAGHIRVPHEVRRDPYPGCCPLHGDCWEGLASGRAIAERWGREPAQLADEHPAWELEAEYLALGLASLVLIASPERIVLGGGVMDRAGLRERVRERLRGLLAGYPPHPLLGERIAEHLLAPALGDRAGVLGALALAAELG
jgi:fructokinase